MLSVKGINISKAKVSHHLRDEILQTYVVHNIETFVRLGFDIKPLLKDVSLSENDLARAQQDSMAMVSYQHLLQIYQNALALSPKENLGLLFGAEMGMSAFGVVSYAILATKKDFNAIQTAIRYQRLILGNFAEFDLAFGDDICEIRFAVNTEDKRLERFYIDHFFANSVGFAQAIIGHESTIKQLRLVFDEPSYRAEYETLFGCEVVFNCKHNAIVFNPSTLVFDLPNTNMATEQALSHVCDELLDSLIETDSISAQLEKLLTDNFSHYNDMQRVADYFHCDQRTLRRKLAIADTSFREIRDHMFEVLATDLLKRGQSIQAVANTLGYASSRTFRKAFTTLTGNKPTLHRLKGNDNTGKTRAERQV